mmetsp:Transcript_117814/g.175990  ORF Transcript_117814/g.175990 Transcript_117814/m.175990 type:complete len:274 (-) Transcript_117814:82-903(-)
MIKNASYCPFRNKQKNNLFLESLFQALLWNAPDEDHKSATFITHRRWWPPVLFCIFLTASPLRLVGLVRLQSRQTTTGRHSHLDTMTLVGDIDFTRKNLSMDLFRSVDKGRLDVVRRLGRRLHKDQSVRFRKRLALFRADRPTMFQIILVSDQHDDHVRLRVLAGFLQPPAQVLEGISPRNIVDQQCPRGSAIITAGNTTERFLAGGIPDLKFDEFVVQVDHAGAELDSNRQIVDGLKSLVGELQQQTGLSDACVTDDDVFEEIGVRHDETRD